MSFKYIGRKTPQSPPLETNSQIYTFTLGKIETFNPYASETYASKTYDSNRDEPIQIICQNFNTFNFDRNFGSMFL